MKTVINITLGSIVFAIEQDAYDALAVYLQSVTDNLSDNADVSEIVSDIETALAEKFIAQGRSQTRAVSMHDVETVTAQMGAPSDFTEDIIASEEKVVATDTPTKKRLYRNPDDAVIAGVASGLATYFAVDPVVVRIIFVISIFFNGLGLLAYIILWLVVPKAQTTTEKYAMRGEAVTIKEITQRVKKNIEKLDSNDFTDAKSAWSGARNVFVKLFDVLGMVIRALMHVARYVVGIVLVLGGALGVAALVSVYSVVLLSDKVLFPTDAQVALDTMLGSGLGIVAICASFVMMVIPLQVLIIAGAGVLGKKNYFTVQKSVTLAVVWIVAIILACTASVLQVERVMQKLGADAFENRNYEIHVNIDDEVVDVDVSITPIEELVPSLSPAEAVQELPETDIVACTADAKICPDGSGVGRVGPNCEFAPCPVSQ